MEKNGLNKFRTIVSEVSSIVGNPAQWYNLKVYEMI